MGVMMGVSDLHNHTHVICAAFHERSANDLFWGFLSYIPQLPGSNMKYSFPVHDQDFQEVNGRPVPVRIVKEFKKRVNGEQWSESRNLPKTQC